MKNNPETQFPTDQYQALPADRHWAGKLLLIQSKNPNSLGFHFLNHNPLAYRDIGINHIIYPGILRVPWSDGNPYETPIWTDISDDKNNPSITIYAELPIKNLHQEFWRFSEESLAKWQQQIDENLTRKGFQTNWRVIKDRKSTYKTGMELTNFNEVLQSYSDVPLISYTVFATGNDVLTATLAALERIYEPVFIYFDQLNRIGIDQTIKQAEKQLAQPPTKLITEFIFDSRVKRIIEPENDQFWTKLSGKAMPDTCEAKVQLKQFPEVTFEIFNRFRDPSIGDDVVIFLWDSKYTFAGYHELSHFLDRYKNEIQNLSKSNNPFKKNLDLSWEYQPPQDMQKNSVLGYYFLINDDQLKFLRKSGFKDDFIAGQLLNCAINMTKGLRKTLGNL